MLCTVLYYLLNSLKEVASGATCVAAAAAAPWYIEWERSAYEGRADCVPCQSIHLSVSHVTCHVVKHQQSLQFVIVTPESRNGKSLFITRVLLEHSGMDCRFFKDKMHASHKYVSSL